MFDGWLRGRTIYFAVRFNSVGQLEKDYQQILRWYLEISFTLLSWKINEVSRVSVEITERNLNLYYW